jgi:hypothetical protein
VTPTATEGIVADQAIFTSIRSPLGGSGYRVVAASPGLASDEKRQIIQCAPSHHSLCDESPGSTALGCFQLNGGRYSLFLSCSAGVEATARGGCRVHTHVLLLTPRDYGRFDFDPLRVQTAAEATLDDQWTRKPPSRLRALPLEPPDGTPGEGQPPTPAPPAAASTPERVAFILAAMLEERRLLVTGVPAPRDTVRWLYAATPMACRARVAISYGIRFAPARPFAIMLEHGEVTKAVELARQQGIDVQEWDTLPNPPSSIYDRWLAFVCRWIGSSRYEALSHLTGSMRQAQAPEALSQVVALSEDLERIPDEGKEAVEELIVQYQHFTPSCPTAARLHERVAQALEARREVFRTADPPPEEQAD